MTQGLDFLCRFTCQSIKFIARFNYARAFVQQSCRYCEYTFSPFWVYPISSGYTFSLFWVYSLLLVQSSRTTSLCRFQLLNVFEIALQAPDHQLARDGCSCLIQRQKKMIFLFLESCRQNVRRDLVFCLEQLQRAVVCSL